MGRPTETTMKTNITNIIVRAVALVIVLLPAQALYAQHTSAAAVLSNSLEARGISSVSEYVRVEDRINALASVLRAAHRVYPNFKYVAAYDQGEIDGFIVTGVSDAEVANKLSSCLMQLQVLGDHVRAMNSAYLPVTDEKAARVSKREATR
jgi:hypothetical protein